MEGEVRSAEGDVPFWTYSLQEMCVKTEFHRPEIFRSMSAKGIFVPFTVDLFRSHLADIHLRFKGTSLETECANYDIVM